MTDPPLKSHHDVISFFCAGKLLIGSLNLNIDPCVDFYAHACGRFQAKEPFGNRYQDIEDLIDDEVVIRMHGTTREPNINIFLVAFVNIMMP